MHRNFLRLQLALCAAVFLTWSLNLSAVPEQSPDADFADWADLDALLKPEQQNLLSMDGGPTVSKKNNLEIRRRRYRDQGLRLWNLHPEDVHRLNWLLRTLENDPIYEDDPEEGTPTEILNKKAQVRRDLEALNLWDKVYEEQLEPAFLAAASITADQRTALLRFRLHSLRNENDFRLRHSDPIDLDEFARLIVKYANQPLVDDSWIENYVGSLFYIVRERREAPSTELKLIQILRLSTSGALRRIAVGKARLTALRVEPMNLQLVTLDGDKFDLTAWRGKVVLLDFWSTTCTTCLEEIPRLKALYATYHDKGFEIVGVSFDRQEDRAKVEAVIAKNKIPWPQSLQPWKDSALKDAYGFSYLGDNFLLDQQGLLRMHDIYGPDLEAEIRRLLGLAQTNQTGGGSTRSSR